MSREPKIKRRLPSAAEQRLPRPSRAPHWDAMREERAARERESGDTSARDISEVSDRGGGGVPPAMGARQSSDQKAGTLPDANGSHPLAASPPMEKHEPCTLPDYCQTCGRALPPGGIDSHRLLQPACAGAVALKTPPLTQPRKT